MENSNDDNSVGTQPHNSNDNNDKEEELDSRVQKFLEILNVKATEINDLEKKIDTERAAFQRIRSELVPQLEEMKKKRAKHIAMAGPYYQALDHLHKCRRSLQATTLLYQQAKLDHEEAKQKVSAVEESFEATGGLEMTQSKQESLNRATNKVNDAEHRKDNLEKEHKMMILSCSEAENRCQILKKALKKPTKKAKSFYDLKDKCNTLLNQHKRQIEKYTRAIKSCKEEYAATLLTLELLSENIHESRSKLNLLRLDESNSVDDQTSDVGNICDYIENLSNPNEFEIYNDEVSVDSSNPSLVDIAEKNCRIDSDDENENVADPTLDNDDRNETAVDSTIEKDCT